jgi:hypothetical protein
MDWFQLKLALSEALGVSQDALHILAGIGLHLLAAALTRRSLAHPLPWLFVAGLVVANEYFDLQLEIWPNRGDQWGETAKDVVTTLLAPTVFLLVARWAPGLLVAPAQRHRHGKS